MKRVQHISAGKTRRAIAAMVIVADLDAVGAAAATVLTASGTAIVTAGTPYNGPWPGGDIPV